MLMILTFISLLNICNFCTVLYIDVPRPLSNDLGVFLLQNIDAERKKSQVGWNICVIVNINTCLNPFFRSVYYIVNKVTLQSLLLIYKCILLPINICICTA